MTIKAIQDSNKIVENFRTAYSGSDHLGFISDETRAAPSKRNTEKGKKRRAM